MIKIVLTIEEESNGAIRFRGAGGNQGIPTKKEVEFCTKIMKAMNEARVHNFARVQSIIPLTIIEQTKPKKPRKKREHKNGD